MRPLLRIRRARQIAWLVPALLAGTTAGPASQAAGDRVAPDGRRPIISGRVIDALTNQPIQGALVEIRPFRGARSRNPRSGRTTADGRFRIGDIPAGRVSVQVSHARYLDGGAGQQRAGGRIPSLEVPAGHALEDVTIRLWPPAIISGRVTDSAGRPLESVRVEARPAGWRDPNDFSASAPTAGTNDRGEYELSALRPGEYHVIVHASHLTWAVNARRPFAVFPDAPSNASMMTSEDGRFRWAPTIGTVPPRLADDREAVFLTTAYPGATHPETFSLIEVEAGSEHHGIDIVMQTAPRVRIRGLAVGPDGQRLERAYIRLRREGREAEIEDVVQATGHADGTFEFLSVPPGSYELDAFRIFGESDVSRPDPDGYWARMPLTVGDQDIDDLTVRMNPGVTVRARVEFQAAPNPGGGGISLVPIRTYPIGSGHGMQRWTPQSFEAGALMPGDYLWSFGSRGDWGVASVTRAGRDITGEPLRVGTSDIDDLVITITGRPAGVRGSVTPPAGTPVELLTVVLFPIEPSKRGTVFLRETLVRVLNLPPEGTYVFEGLPPGRYVVAAIDEATRDEWPSPDLMDRLASTSSPVTITTGDVLTHNLVARR